MHRIAAFIVGAAILLATPATVAAAAPSNDNFADATVIGSVPYSDDVITTDATTQALDFEAEAGCLGGLVTHTVWYSFTPSHDGTYEVYDQHGIFTGLVVVTGAPGSFSQVACDAKGYLQFDGTASTSYAIMVSDTSEEGIGGDVLFTIDEILPPPPPPEVTIDPLGWVSRATGFVTVSGTMTCIVPSWVTLQMEVRQRAGRQYIFADGFVEEPILCDGELAWSVTARYLTGVFVGGKATVELLGFAAPAGPSTISPAATGPGFDIIASIRLRSTR